MTSYTVDYNPNSFGQSNVDNFRARSDSIYGGKNNFALIDTPKLNEADIMAITNKTPSRIRTDTINNPSNLLNDPILNRAIANDPSLLTYEKYIMQV